MREVINWLKKRGTLMNKVDQLLAFHCAPTLFGLKPANLIAHAAEVDIMSAKDVIDALLIQGIVCEELCSCDRKRLTLVYREKMLKEHLNAPEVWGFLLSMGYPVALGFGAVINHLKKRVIMTGGFPHEVGVFLGYPLEDVMGFIKNKGQNCKLCGYWKVYGDADRAKSLFHQFNSCRDQLMHQLMDGGSITQYVSAA